MNVSRWVGVSVVLVLSFVGCSRRPKYSTVYPAGPVQVSSPREFDKSCVDRLLFRSRYTGYIEQTVDKDAQFFRVLTRNREFRTEFDKKGRPVPLKLAPGQRPAVIEFYNVQCMGPDVALVTPMNARGPLLQDSVMDRSQREELDNYARAIGVPVAPMASGADQPPPPPPPLP